jgi:hypothetical protein
LETKQVTLIDTGIAVENRVLEKKVGYSRVGYSRRERRSRGRVEEE